MFKNGLTAKTTIVELEELKQWTHSGTSNNIRIYIAPFESNQ